MKPNTESATRDEIAIVQDDEPVDRREWLQRLRARADEARILADKMQFPTARNMMLRLAGTFEDLAERLEQQQAQQARLVATPARQPAKSFFNRPSTCLAVSGFPISFGGIRLMCFASSPVRRNSVGTRSAARSIVNFAMPVG